jgi:predicted HTH transcriptional regulator
VTSTLSLTACAPADVTWDRVQGLVASSPHETLTLEYKSVYTPGLVKTVAAMANTYGGLVLVGVLDSKQVVQGHTADRIVGVSGETVTKIANGCDNCLEPPWQPEIIPVAIPGEQDKFVLVVRVGPARAPRPVLFEGKAPIWLHGNNATADRTRLAQLFAETAAPAGGARLACPDLHCPVTTTARRPRTTSCAAACRSP